MFSVLLLLSVKTHLGIFYKMDLYEKNYEMAQSFFNFIEGTSTQCDVFHDDYKGEKYTCTLPDLPRKFQHFLSDDLQK